MAEAVTTYPYRRKLASRSYAGGQAPQPTHMGFGDGGHESDGSPKNPNPEKTTLNHELLRKALDSTYQEDDYSLTGVGRVAKSELIGASMSEAGLFDEDGELMGFKNMAVKIKESDEEYEVRIKLKY